MVASKTLLACHVMGWKDLLDMKVFDVPERISQKILHWYQPLQPKLFILLGFIITKTKLAMFTHLYIFEKILSHKRI